MHIREHLNAENPAVVLYPSGATISFADLEIRANRLAHYFRHKCLGEGDAIAVVMENNIHMHAVMWAARRTGLYYVLVNTHLTPAEAAYIMSDSGAVAVVASRALRNLACQAVALLVDAPSVRLLTDDDADGWDRYPDCVATLADSPIADEIEGDLLQYSSGTTGRPKGIRRELPHTVPADSPIQLQPMLSLLGVTRESVYLTPAPLYHTAPAYWSMSVQAVGATVVVMEKFTPDGALDAISKYGVTHGQFVPAMFVRMLKLSAVERLSYDTSSLQRVVHAAAPCPQDIKRQMIDWWGPIVDEFYSSSEGAGISFIRAEDWLTHPGSVGKPVLGIPHILDENGAELPAGRPGILYFENAMPFEYLGDATKTAAARNDRDWSTVGDIGYLDEEGYLYLTDRRHHMIISGGVNIYPQEAEDALIGHPDVLDAAVFGIPHPEMGQSVKAVVQLVRATSDPEKTAAELLTWIRRRLAHYKCPRSISIEAQLPRSDTGKLFKQALIDKYSQPASPQSIQPSTPGVNAMIKNGTRLRSQVCETQVIVVRTSEALQHLRCGGAPMIAIGREPTATAQLDPALSCGSVLGKRYVDDSGAEVLVTKAGAGTLSAGSSLLRLKEAKPLPASD